MTDFSAHDIATANSDGFRAGEAAAGATIATLKGQRAVLCSLLRECLPMIDQLTQYPGTDATDAHLHSLGARITSALDTLAEDEVKGGES